MGAISELKFIFHIYGRDFLVKFCQVSNMPLPRKIPIIDLSYNLDDDYIGVYDPNPCLIVIKPTHKIDEICGTLCHELAHACQPPSQKRFNIKTHGYEAYYNSPREVEARSMERHAREMREHVDMFVQHFRHSVRELHKTLPAKIPDNTLRLPYDIGDVSDGIKKPVLINSRRQLVDGYSRWCVAVRNEIPLPYKVVA